MSETQELDTQIIKGLTNLNNQDKVKLIKLMGGFNHGVSSDENRILNSLSALMGGKNQKSKKGGSQSSNEEKENNNGKSPLQNLILLGLKKTKISALKVNKFVDSGDIYLKKELSLNGKAQQIYKRANDIIFKMILEIVKENPLPKKQQGEPTFFKRRKPYMSNIKNLNNDYKNYSIK